MNLSVIEKMSYNGDMSADGLRYLLECRGECEWLDYKQDLLITNDEQLCDFARDVLAIKNMGGGFIVVGVVDKSWKPIGISIELPYDTKLIRDKVRKATGHDLELDIVHHRIYADGQFRLFALIYIRSKRKRSKRRLPTLVNKDFLATKAFGLRRGETYARRGDSTVRISSENELSDLLDNLENQSDEQSMLTSGSQSPFAIQDGLYRLLEKGFEQFVGRQDLCQEVLTAITRDPRVWIINVHGPGGVGKSALVNWCVYQFYEKREFEAIIQLTAKETVLTASGIKQYSRSLYSIENLLDHILENFGEKPPANLDEKQKQVVEILTAWRTLLVLDNMETVQDGRILRFVQALPPSSLAKVLITSRNKSGGWELPIPVRELNIEEVEAFIQIRRQELEIDFPIDKQAIRRVTELSGGLPLAVQWILGRYRILRNFQEVADAVNCKDSPVLEFSFRNIWQILSADARQVLAITTIFDNPPTSQQISVALDFPVDRIERALVELTDTTLLNRSTHDSRVTYVALPITIDFARHQLGEMGNLEVESRRRFQRFSDQINLHEMELGRFRSRFEKFGLLTDSERRAAILCQKGESDMFVGDVVSADLLFRQARDLVPNSSYTLAMSASYELARNRVGNAISFIEQACDRANRKTGALCYTIKARILQVQRDRHGRVAALQRAVEYDPDDHILRHQYGVALSINGNPQKAIEQFTIIIEAEKNNIPPNQKLLIALKTRMLNNRRIGQEQAVKYDYEMVNRIFLQYPQLAKEAHQFQEFFDEDDN